jgi:nucleolar protein 12
MSVDPALLLDGVKMAGDRKLRVTRAKAIKRKEAAQKIAARNPAPRSGKVYVPKADPKEQANLGRATKLLGRAGAAQLKSQSAVFEGFRASANDDAGIKKGGTGKKKGKPRARAQARSGAWKKGQVKPRAAKGD